ncbi:MAG: nucleotide exchange factor GrpE [Bacteroidaceae bacterium]|nr:nucleotide exchange factor GrpE [Bacteroidaceae bacterium]
MGLFTNKESEHSIEKNQFEQTIENIKAECEKLIQENKAKDEEILNLKKTIEALKGQAVPQENTPEQPIVAEEKPETPVVGTDYAPALEAINASIKELTAKSDELKTMIGYRDIQDENVKAMHKELEKFRGNFYAKITQPYLMAMLDLHKRFFETYAHFDHLDNSEADMSQLYSNLMEQFKSAVDALENRIYNDFGVEYYLPQEGDDFNPKQHQAFEVITTGIESYDKKIAKVIYGGFRDIDTERILRPARIACYKYQLIIE